MNYYPRIKLEKVAIYIEYPETKEHWNLFTGTITKKTGVIIRELDRYQYTVTTKVRLKHNDIWYIVNVKDTWVIPEENEATFKVDELINKVINEGYMVQNYFVFPNTIPQWIEKDPDQRDDIKEKPLRE